MATSLVEADDLGRSTGQDYSEVVESSGEFAMKVPPLFEYGFFRLCEGTLNSKTGYCKALCLNCSSRREFSGSIRVTSNFVKHLRMAHIEEYEDYQAKLKQKRPKLKRKYKPAQSQAVVTFQPCKTAQSEIDNLILDCILNCNLAISVVEHDSFRSLVSKLSGGIARATTSETLERLLEMRVEKQKTFTKAVISNASHVAATANIWHMYEMNMLWVTVHWIDDITLTGHSLPMRCERFADLNTIAQMLKSILEDLDVTKVTRMIINNLRNSADDFRKSGIDCQDYSFANFRNSDRFILDFGSFSTLLNGDEEDKIIELPPTEQCASLVLSCIAASCVNSAKVNFPLAHRHLFEKTFAKLSALWNYQKRSLDAEEVIKDTLGKRLLVPHSGILNSLRDSLQCVITCDRQKMNKMLYKISVTEMKMSEFDLLEEYIEVIKPITSALEKIEEEDTRYGHIIPIIRQTYKQLRLIKSDELVFCRPILDCLIVEVEKRFEGEIAQNDTVNDKLLATVAHPFFKMRPILKEHRPRVRDLILNVARNEAKGSTSIHKQQVLEKGKADYYEFSDDEDVVGEERSSLEVHQYLQDVDTSLSMLHRYPIIKRLHIKYNSALPSSVPMKRHFNFVFTSLQATNLFDKNFESLLELKMHDYLRKQLTDPVL